MNISVLNNNNIANHFKPTFAGRRKLPKDILPEKLELTPLESEYNEMLVQQRRLERNLSEQRRDLYDYYSRSSKDDYNEQMRLNRNLKSRMKRLASKSDQKQIMFEIGVDTKKEYNRFAPKIYRAKNKAELQEIVNLISESFLYTKAKEMLFKLISQFELILKK